VVFAIVVAVFGAGVCLADSLYVQHDRWQDEYTWVDTGACSFPVTVTGSSNIDDLWFLDESGTPWRLLSTVNHGTITFSANGKTVDAKGSGGIEYIWNPDGSVEVHTFGINLLATIPHYGSVFLDAGSARYLFDPHLHLLFQAGPSRYDEDVFCGALT